MRENGWTDEQLKAISENGCNLLVAAAAGAGKTAVLVERIIRKITDGENPVDIDRLLVVTFTNAAAAEMRERIGDAITKALDKNPGSKRLQRQLMLLNKANIITIHSFCLDVIKNNFHCIDLDPGFRIADETESALMKLETLDELFEDMYEEERYEDESEREQFLQLVECYGGSRDDRMLQNMVLAMYDFVQSFPWPQKWLKEKAEAFNLPEGSDFGSTPWAKVLVKSIKIELHGIINLMRGALSEVKHVHGVDSYVQCFNDDISKINGLLTKCCGACSTWNELYDAFSGFEFDRLPNCGKDAGKAKQEQLKAIRNEVKDKIKKMRKEIFVSDSAVISGDLKGLYPLLNCLSHLIIEFGQRYALKKKAKSLLDFNDLEHFCLEILTEPKPDDELQKAAVRIVPSKDALRFRERFEEILVDEYQDSNLVQEVILSIISRKDTDLPNVFLVGDVKQSIYRFRQARPELFLEKYNTYSSTAGARDRKIQLFKNFRSRGEVISAVNCIFKQIMSENIGELDYNENEALNSGFDYELPEEPDVVVGGAVELLFVDVGTAETDNGENGYETPDNMGKSGSAYEGESVNDSELMNNGETINEGGEDEKPDAVQAEARVVARRIKELMAPDEDGKVFKIFDKELKAYRKLEFKDIVILLRTTRNWSDIFMEELGVEGIPAYADTGTGYFKTAEINTVMSLLQIIDNPMQDIPMLAVLRSPIASFSPEELVDIRLCGREESFYEAMKKLAASEEKESIEGGRETAEKTGKFLQSLEVWRDKALYMSTDELIWYLYSDTGYYSYAGAMPGGVQRQVNLRMLFEKARQYEATSYKGLFNLINFVSRLRSSQGDMGSAKILGENENVVRIMSIHKSKGLEFPVVIVAGCGKRFNLQDMNGRILVHQDLGFGPDFVDSKRRIFYNTVPKQALKCKIKLDTLSEEMRILYVAFTRAKEKLIISGTVKNIRKAAAIWYDCSGNCGAKLPEYEMLKARSFMDWIAPSVIRHKDCTLLRQIAGVAEGALAGAAEDVSVDALKDTLTGDDSSMWEVRLWDMRSIIEGSLKATHKEMDFSSKVEALDISAINGMYSEEVRRRLDWEYPFKMSAKVPTKLTVTELKRRVDTKITEEYPPQTVYMQPLIKKPAFMEKIKGLSTAEKGTVLHFVMQHLDLDRISIALDEEEASSKAKVSAEAEVLNEMEKSSGANSKTGLSEEVEYQVGGMVLGELLTMQQAKTVDSYIIEKFLRSPLGLRMLHAQKINREVPFNIDISCTEIYKDLPEETYGEETVLVQGVIDCYFEEQKYIVLVDYKTDYVPENGSNLIREKYRIQVEYYTRALERITGKKVKDRYIYLFWNGEAIKY